MSRSGTALLGVLALVPPSSVDMVDPVAVENMPPTVVIEAPADGGFAQPGEAVPFRLTVTDDGVVDCTEVVVTYDFPVPVAPDCTGVLAPEAAAEAHTFSAQYTDAGSLTGSAE